MKLNLADTEAFGGFDPLPGGWYHVKVTDAQDTETKNEGKLAAGTPGVNWEFTVQDGDFQGRRAWTNQWFHERTMGFVKGLLKATGRFTDDQLDSPEFDLDYDEVLGSDLYIRLTVKTGEYEGNDVKSIKAWNGEESKPSATAGASSGGGSLLP